MNDLISLPIQVSSQDRMMGSEVEGLRLRSSQGLKPIEVIWRRERDEEEEKEEEEPVSPASAMFHEPDFNVYVIAVLGSKTTIDPLVMKDKLRHTLLKHPRFSSIQVVDEKTGEMKRVRTKVNLDNHVIFPNLDPDDIVSPDKFVEDYIFNMSKASIDMSKPMWDIHFLNLKTSQAEAVAILRAHHSLGDGTSLMSLLLACTRQISDPGALPTIPEMRRKPERRERSKFWEALLRVWWVLTLAWNTVIDVTAFMATAWFLKDTETPLKGGAGVEFAPRRLVHRTVSLDDIKLVKNALNTTINDVALGVAQAGLSRYLNRKYGDGKNDRELATETQNNLPKNIRLRATLLINLRPAKIKALADMMEKDSEAKWGNWIGFVLLPFNIALRDDPLSYVREAKATVDRKKHSLEAVYTFSVADMFLKFFGTKSANALSHKAIHNTTMCFSNLVGPVEEIGFYGYPIAYIAPSSYGIPHALMINFQSYVNKMTIVVSVDEGTIPDPHQLCDDLVESLNLIKDAVVARGVPNAG